MYLSKVILFSCSRNYCFLDLLYAKNNNFVGWKCLSLHV